jgi:hypothetical protein
MGQLNVCGPRSQTGGRGRGPSLRILMAFASTAAGSVNCPLVQTGVPFGAAVLRIVGIVPKSDQVRMLTEFISLLTSEAECTYFERNSETPPSGDFGGTG